MTGPVPDERRAALERALTRFAEVLARDPSHDDMLVDAAIQRFEFCIELFWRVAQSALRREGVVASSPRAVLRAAYAQGWLAQEQPWLDMLEDRNRTSHTYRHSLAMELLSRLPAHLAALRAATGAIPAGDSAPAP